MADTEASDAVTKWLRDNLPGGQWILPHWQDGPFWLVPVLDANDADWQVELLLAAHDPLVEQLPIPTGWGDWAGADMYAVSQFTRDTLLWHHDSESGLALDGENIMGPFDQRPTPGDLVAALPQLLALDTDDLGDRGPVLARALATLAEHPGSALKALSAIYQARLPQESATGEELDTAGVAIALLLAAAGMLFPAT